jgi:hypothetical protein
VLWLVRSAVKTLLWPMGSARRAVGSASALALLWLLVLRGDDLARRLGLGRPPERQIELWSLDLVAAPAVLDEAAWATRYEALDVSARSVLSEQLRARLEAACESAFADLRRAGGGRTVPFVRGGDVPLDGAADPSRFARVVLDPREAPGRRPVALVLELEPGAWPEPYAIAAELRWLLGLSDGAGAPPLVE